FGGRRSLAQRRTCPCGPPSSQPIPSVVRAVLQHAPNPSPVAVIQPQIILLCNRLPLPHVVALICLCRQVPARPPVASAALLAAVRQDEIQRVSGEGQFLLGWPGVAPLIGGIRGRDDVVERQLGSDGEGLAGEVIEPLPGAHLAVAWVGVAHLGEAGENQDLVAGILAVAIKIVIQDRKSTRLNSSHVKISYAVFCLKKKKK